MNNLVLTLALLSLFNTVNCSSIDCDTVKSFYRTVTTTGDNNQTNSGCCAGGTFDVDSCVASKDDIPDISGLALASNIPDISGLAQASDIPDISGLAQASDIPDISGLALASDIPDISGLALASDIHVLEESTRSKFATTRSVSRSAEQATLVSLTLRVTGALPFADTDAHVTDEAAGATLFAIHRSTQSDLDAISTMQAGYHISTLFEDDYALSRFLSRATALVGNNVVEDACIVGNIHAYIKEQALAAFPNMQFIKRNLVNRYAATFEQVPLTSADFVVSGLSEFTSAGAYAADIDAYDSWIHNVMWASYTVPSVTEPLFRVSYDEMVDGTQPSHIMELYVGAKEVSAFEWYVVHAAALGALTPLLTADESNRPISKRHISWLGGFRNVAANIPWLTGNTFFVDFMNAGYVDSSMSELVHGYYAMDTSFLDASYTYTAPTAPASLPLL